MHSPLSRIIREGRITMRCNVLIVKGQPLIALNLQDTVDELGPTRSASAARCCSTTVVISRHHQARSWPP